MSEKEKCNGQRSCVEENRIKQGEQIEHSESPFFYSPDFITQLPNTSSSVCIDISSIPKQNLFLYLCMRQYMYVCVHVYLCMFTLNNQSSIGAFGICFWLYPVLTTTITTTTTDICFIFCSPVMQVLSFSLSSIPLHVYIVYVWLECLNDCFGAFRSCTGFHLSKIELEYVAVI